MRRHISTKGQTFKLKSQSQSWNVFLSTAFSLPESPSSEIFHMYLTLQTPHLPFNRFLSSSLSPPSYRVERRGDICRLMINMTLRSAPRALQTPPTPQLSTPFLSLYPSLSVCSLACHSQALSLSLFIFHSVYYSFIYWHECYMSKWKSISSLPNVRSFRIMCYSRHRSVDSWFTLPRLARLMDSST